MLRNDLEEIRRYLLYDTKRHRPGEPEGIPENHQFRNRYRLSTTLKRRRLKQLAQQYLVVYQVYGNISENYIVSFFRAQSLWIKKQSDNFTETKFAVWSQQTRRSLWYF
jgi:hypothetical protein